MKKDIALMSIVSSLPCAVVCMIYTFLPAPMNGLLWCMFVGYCTTNCVGPAIKKIPNILSSYIIGILWALAFHFGFIWLFSLGLSVPIAMLLSIEIVTALLVFVHVGLLQNTWANIIPLLFPCVFTLFASQGDFSIYPFMVVSILIGSLTASFAEPITNLILKPQKNEIASDEF
ncbi:DUF1097 family protein [Acetobacterium wieringae]|uniref:DUF1097 family protein n=1 Tax=Acetobacterium wieringae TaxID=52694 RepID=UPI002B204898|nr:DUF1097 family protein [Acetobacterium wieringae]MEA4807431.1 DUF1097 family protein [Acetobacterium wieringae]